MKTRHDEDDTPKPPTTQLPGLRSNRPSIFAPLLWCPFPFHVHTCPYKIVRTYILRISRLARAMLKEENTCKHTHACMRMCAPSSAPASVLGSPSDLFETLRTATGASAPWLSGCCSVPAPPTSGGNKGITKGKRNVKKSEGQPTRRRDETQRRKTDSHAMYVAARQARQHGHVHLYMKKKKKTAREKARGWAQIIPLGGFSRPHPSRRLAGISALKTCKMRPNYV